MTDIADRAAEAEQAIISEAMRNRKRETIAPRGRCLNPNCCDEFEAGDRRLFCDRQCADEHKELERMKEFNIHMMTRVT